MKAYFVTFRSITFAQRGETVLAKAGISCTLQRTPRWMEAKGCGYCLRVPWQRGTDAVYALRAQQVDFQRIYLKKENGMIEEVAL